MSLPSFEYAAAHIFAIEHKLLSRERVERMIDAPSPSDALRVLSETEYAAGVSELSGPYDYEELLSGEVRRIYEFFQTISPAPEITDLFFLKYDFHNLKVLLKSRYLDQGQDEFLIEDGGTLSINTLKNAIKEQNYEGLPDYIGRVLEEIDEAMDTKVDPLKMVVMLDKAMYGYIFNTCKKNRDKFTSQYFSLQVDLINIRTFLRVRKIEESSEFLRNMLLPNPNSQLDKDFFINAMEKPIEHLMDHLKPMEYGEITTRGIEEYINRGSLLIYERLMDDYLLGYVRNSRWNPSGIEPIIGYLLAKENEIKIIRIIMVGKINNLPAHIIRERLRDVYV